MGFYIRKSVSVGPIRFNLSKGGVGVSTGVRGFRVGTGPRGSYVHMGRGGLYYRQSLETPSEPKPSPTPTPPAQTVDEMVEIDSSAVLEMRDASSEELLADIKARRALPSRWPLVLLLGTVLSIVLLAVHPLAFSVGLVVAVILTLRVKRNDDARRTCVPM